MTSAQIRELKAILAAVAVQIPRRTGDDSMPVLLYRAQSLLDEAKTPASCIAN